MTLRSPDRQPHLRTDRQPHLRTEGRRPDRAAKAKIDRRWSGRPRAWGGRGGAGAVALLAGLAAGTAHAEPPHRGGRLAILASVLSPARADGSALREGELFDAAARAAALRPGLETIPYDELLGDAARPLPSEVRECGADLRCAAAALRRAGADLGLRVLVNQAVDPPLLVTTLFDAGGAERDPESVVELERDRAVAPAAEHALASLFERAGFSLGGGLRIAVHPGDANLSLQGRPLDPAARIALVLAPGRYEIQAQREGYASGRAEAVVLSGQTVQIAIDLAPEAPASGGAPWLWIALAAGAVVAGGATFLALGPLSGGHGEHACVCVTTPESPCSARCP